MKSPHLSTSNINRTSPPATQILKTALTNQCRVSRNALLTSYISAVLESAMEGAKEK